MRFGIRFLLLVTMVFVIALACWLYPNRPAAFSVGTSKETVISELGRLDALDLCDPRFSATYSVSIPFPEGASDEIVQRAIIERQREDDLDWKLEQRYWYLPNQWIRIETVFVDGRLTKLFIWEGPKNASLLHIRASVVSECYTTKKNLKNAGEQHNVFEADLARLLKNQDHSSRLGDH